MNAEERLAEIKAVLGSYEDLVPPAFPGCACLRCQAVNRIWAALDEVAAERAEAERGEQ